MTCVRPEDSGTYNQLIEISKNRNSCYRSYQKLSLGPVFVCDRIAFDTFETDISQYLKIWIKNIELSLNDHSRLL